MTDTIHQMMDCIRHYTILFWELTPVYYEALALAIDEWRAEFTEAHTGVMWRFCRLYSPALSSALSWVTPAPKFSTPFRQMIAELLESSALGESRSTMDNEAGE